MAKTSSQESVPHRLPESVTFSAQLFRRLLGFDLRWHWACALAWKWETQPGPLPHPSKVPQVLPRGPAPPHAEDLTCRLRPIAAFFMSSYLFSLSSLGKEVLSLLQDWRQFFTAQFFWN